MSSALILDFDGSVAPLPAADTIDLRERQEAIRFGCGSRALSALARELEPALARRPRVVYMGSGDYHHVSYLLIERWRAAGERIRVVVFDNHPDNMRYPFGIHCGSWVRHVSRLPFVARIDVVGITSRDVEGARAWQNYLVPLYRNKVAYFCVGRSLRALARLGIKNGRSYPSCAAMFAALAGEWARAAEPIYVSIDKDVLAPDVARTNWDQGVMRFEELAAAIARLRGRIVAADVVGDASVYRYRGWFKRSLSALDRQPEISAQAAAQAREAHWRLNRDLLALLA